MCTYKEHLNEWISAHLSILRSRLLSSENLCLVILWLRLTAVQLLSDRRDNAVCDKIIRPYICSFKSYQLLTASFTVLKKPGCILMLIIHIDFREQKKTNYINLYI